MNSLEKIVKRTVDSFGLKQEERSNLKNLHNLSEQIKARLNEARRNEKEKREQLEKEKEKFKLTQRTNNALIRMGIIHEINTAEKGYNEAQREYNKLIEQVYKTGVKFAKLARTPPHVVNPIAKLFLSYDYTEKTFGVIHDSPITGIRNWLERAIIYDFYPTITIGMKFPSTIPNNLKLLNLSSSEEALEFAEEMQKILLEHLNNYKPKYSNVKKLIGPDKEAEKIDLLRILEEEIFRGYKTLERIYELKEEKMKHAFNPNIIKSFGNLLPDIQKHIRINRREKLKAIRIAGALDRISQRLEILVEYSHLYNYLHRLYEQPKNKGNKKIEEELRETKRIIKEEVDFSFNNDLESLKRTKFYKPIKSIVEHKVEEVLGYITTIEDKR